MVRLLFDPNNPYIIRISRNWKDNVYQILALVILFFIFLVFLIISLAKQTAMMRAFLIWEIVITIIIIYYLFPSKRIFMHLDNNFWSITHYFLFIPVKRVKGKVSDISNIITKDFTYEDRDYSGKLTLNKTKYFSSLEFWGFDDKSTSHEKKTENSNVSEEDGPQNSQKDPIFSQIEKWILFSQKTYNYRVHFHEMEENVRVAKILEEFFEGIQLQIEYISKREVRNKNDLISEN